MADMMDFSQALDSLKDSWRVRRAGWNGKGMWIELISDWEITAHFHGAVADFEHAPFIVMKTADNTIVPWLASQTDILAEDWEHVD